MEDHAIYRSPDGPITGLILFVIGCSTLALPLWVSESDFLGTRIRRGGALIKLIEQTIGWTAFTILMMMFAVWCITVGIAAFWKMINSEPDVRADGDQIEFHPALRREPARCNEIDYWTLHFASGHPVLTIYFFEKFWSLQSKWPRKSMTLEGGREDLEDLVQFFSNHPYMSSRFRG